MRRCARTWDRQEKILFSLCFFPNNGVFYLLQTNEVTKFHLQKLRYGHHHHEGRLAFVGTPLADGCRVFPQLLSKPFVGFALVNQYGLYSIQLLVHSNKFVDSTDKDTQKNGKVAYFAIKRNFYCTFPIQFLNMACFLKLLLKSWSLSHDLGQHPLNFAANKKQ